ncbi:unnamed protein product [Paramecium sonneborni]|uniref:Uncharacterized protein n=1 Tax=Paramecium sonneborni TaxID=65129 RepID=A0A8S1P949_9CILI|nr:unnamed protein product [Paramecium sonneborni]
MKLIEFKNVLNFLHNPTRKLYNLKQQFIGIKSIFKFHFIILLQTQSQSHCRPGSKSDISIPTVLTNHVRVFQLIKLIKIESVIKHFINHQDLMNLQQKQRHLFQERLSLKYCGLNY